MMKKLIILFLLISVQSFAQSFDGMPYGAKLDMANQKIDDQIDYWQIVKPLTSCVIDDEFTGGGTASGFVAKLGWLHGNVGSPGGVTIAFQASTTSDPFVLRFDSGTTINTGYAVYGWSMFADECEFFLRAQIGSVAAVKFVLGMGDGPLDSTDIDHSQNALEFVFDAGANANWICISESGNTRTADTTSTAAATGWHNFRIVEASSVARFYIDGSLVSTITTNLPGTGNDVYPVFRTITTSGTGKYLDLGYFRLVLNSLSRGTW